MIGSWLGLASIRFTHAPTPLVLRTKDGEKKSLAEVCMASVPPCRLNPFLFNGHLQTMWTAVSTEGPQIYYRRKVFDADHATYFGSFAVDFAVPPHKDVDDTLPPRTAYYSDEDFAALGSDDSRPMLVVMHGLSGGSYELYLREGIAPLLAEGSDWDVLVVISRGCAKSPITSGVLFNARATWDVRQVVKWCRKTYPNRPLFGLGFSLGANIITNYVGEEGANCLLSGAIAVGSPFNLEVSNKALKRSTLGLHVYQRVMGSNVKRLVAEHKESLEAHSKLDFERIANTTYLYEFDRAVQCPCWGYPTEDAYYRDSSSSDAILGIRIPFLAISATDDPIAVDEAVPYEEFKQNPFTVHCSTSLGGHLSWFELGGGRWHKRPIEKFLRTLASNIDLNFSRSVSNNDIEPKPRGTLGFDPLRRRMIVKHLDAEED
ncbi:hypothetical protein RB595_006771 [Gaeumannomyces hyphopodioides]